MKEIQIKNTISDYSIILGNNILNIIPKKINKLCHKANKIGIIIDKNVPIKFIIKLKKLLGKYEIYIFEYQTSEKLKSFSNVNKLAETLL